MPVIHTGFRLQVLFTFPLSIMPLVPNYEFWQPALALSDPPKNMRNEVRNRLREALNGQLGTCVAYL